jgi:hypothetical protein
VGEPPGDELLQALDAILRGAVDRDISHLVGP